MKVRKQVDSGPRVVVGEGRVEDGRSVVVESSCLSELLGVHFSSAHWARSLVVANVRGACRLSRPGKMQRIMSWVDRFVCQKTN